VEHAHGHPGSALIFLGSLTYCAGGAVTHVLARRGFATTERALGAVEAAQTAQRVAEERWQARREADRLLHDTVLATRTALRLARDLRRELVEDRSGSWLLPASPSAASGNGSGIWPGIVLLDPVGYWRGFVTLTGPR
jgi:hypothetical protein